MKQLVLWMGVAWLLVSCGETPQDQPQQTAFPWRRYEAEDASTNATVSLFSRTYLTPEAESSGRRHVRLEKTGDRVEFTIHSAGDGLVVRYCIPDSPAGGGLAASLGVFVNGERQAKIPLTSRHAWNYGDFPWPDDPSLGRAHHFFDETNLRLPPLKAGDRLELRKEADDKADYVLVDFVELEPVPAPLPQPMGSLSLRDFGATPGDGRDDAAALRALLETASREGRTAWIPEGVFELNGERIPLPRVKIQGAGMWHSRLGGSRPMFAGTGQSVEISDLGIFGDTNVRNDASPDNAFHGNLGDGSVFQNLWIEHLKCGFWTTRGTKNLRLERSRLRNLMADGVNFCNGTSHSTVRECHVRNCGDDGLATWSPREGDSRVPGVGNRFLGNLVELQWHANGIAIYGGADHLVEGNTVIGTVFSGGGLHVSSAFHCVPYSGPVRLVNNEIRDAGGDCYIGQRIGAVWIHGKDSEIQTPVIIENLHVIDPQGPALSIHGPAKVADVQLLHAHATGLPAEAVRILPGASGRLRMTGGTWQPQPDPVVKNESSGFQVDLEAAR